MNCASSWEMQRATDCLPALHASLVLGVLAVETETDAGPARVMEHLNHALCRRSIAARFVTLFYAVFTADHRVVYSNAEHCQPLLINHHRVERLGAGGATSWSLA